MKSARWSGVEARRLGCGVYCEIHARTSIKDAKKKQAPAFEQIEEVMGNAHECCEWRREVGTGARTTWRSGKQSGKEASKQAVGVNEIKLREKMKKDCCLSGLEQGRSERHLLVNWKSL
jgi:hypothetical protein